MKAYLSLVIVMMLFSGNLIVGKAVNDIPPFTIAFFRSLIAFIVMLPIGFRQWRRSQHVFKTEWKPFLGMALTGVAMFNALVYASLQFTTSSNVAIVETTTPVFTIALGVMFLKDRLHFSQGFGIMMSLIGALWVITQGSLGNLLAMDLNLGDLIMVTAVIIWSVYSVLVKRHNHKFPEYGGLVAMLAVAVITLFPFALVEWIVGTLPALDGQRIAGLIYLGVFPSVIALILYNNAVREVGPSKASVYFNLLPVFTIIGAIVFLDESIQMEQIIGAVFVVVGVYLSTRRKVGEARSTDPSVGAQQYHH